MFFQQSKSGGIEFASRIFPQGVKELAILGRRQGEQGHGRTELQIVRRAEDLVQRTSVNQVYEPGAFSKPRTEDWVQGIGPGFVERRNREPVRGGTAAQTFHLRKDVPHPVRSLASGAQFGACVFVVLLSFNETLEIVGVSGRNGMIGSHRQFAAPGAVTSITAAGNDPFDIR
jgi:hypothetical protein